MTLGRKEMSGYRVTLSGQNCRNGGSTRSAASSDALQADVMAMQNKTLKDRKCLEEMARSSKGGSDKRWRTMCSDHWGIGEGLGGLR